MSKLFKNLKISLILLLITLFVIVVKNVSSYIFLVDSFSCQMDKTISDSHSCEIIRFLNDNKDIKSLPLKEITDILKKKFPLIKFVKSSKEAS